MMKQPNPPGILVFAEQTAGCLNPVCLELLGKARELKKQAGATAPVLAAVLGRDISSLAAELAAYGADEIILADDPRLALFENDACALVMADIIRAKAPAIVLIGATAAGSDLAPVLGVRLHTGVAAHCLDLRLNDKGELVSVVPAFGGKVLGDILCPHHRPQIATVKPGILAKPDRQAAASPVISSYDPAPALAKNSGRVKALGIHRQEPKGLPLENAEVVVAGGWGVASANNWRLVEKLASLLGGAAGCTRPAVDEGWAAGEHQMIGTSGKSVRPKVYIGFGVSGATHHICGMKDAGLIISVNKDEKASIFDVSDLKIVGDSQAILTALVEALEQRRG